MTTFSTLAMLTIATAAALVTLTAADANARGSTPAGARVTNNSPPPPVVRRPNGVQGNVLVTTTPRRPGVVCRGWTCPTVIRSTNRDHRGR